MTPVCPGCGDPANAPDARFCRLCGASLFAQAADTISSAQTGFANPAPPPRPAPPPPPAVRMVAPPQPPPRTEPPPSSSKLPFIVLGCGCLLFLFAVAAPVVAGFVVAQRRAAEERAEAEAQRRAAEDFRHSEEEEARVDACKTPDELEALMKTLEHERARERARERLDDLSFEKAQAAGQLADITRYLARFPQGRHLDEAKTRLEAIQADAEEAVSFLAAKTGGDAEATAYLASYAPARVPSKDPPAEDAPPPAGSPLSPKANAALAFIERHPDSENVAQAREMLADALAADQDPDRQALARLVRSACEETPPRLRAHVERSGGGDVHEKAARKWLEGGFAKAKVAVEWVEDAGKAGILVALNIGENAVRFGEKKVPGESIDVKLTAGEWTESWTVETPMEISVPIQDVEQPTAEDVSNATADLIATVPFFPE